jgi:hypothetical protein
MSVADILIDIVNFLIQKAMLPLLPSDIPFYGLDVFTATLNTFKNNLIDAFSGFGFIFPMSMVLSFVLIVLFAELALFLFKAGKFLINVGRGSGA